MNLPSLSHRAFFGFSFACRYREEPPRIDADLRDWGPEYRVPDLSGIDGGPAAFGELCMAWNDDGLYFALEVKGDKTAYKVDPRKYWQGDSLEMWIDTRDVKDAHTANRFCHHFYFLPGGQGRDGKSPIGRQTSIDKAREQAPPCPEELIEVALKRLKRSYRMEMHLPARGLNGFQPREFQRLGFNYILHDSDLGSQSWSVSRGSVPAVHDPSTWGSVDLLSINPQHP